MGPRDGLAPFVLVQIRTAHHRVPYLHASDAGSRLERMLDDGG